jgi:hypothetical protein
VVGEGPADTFHVLVARQLCGDPGEGRRDGDPAERGVALRREARAHLGDLGVTQTPSEERHERDEVLLREPCGVPGSQPTHDAGDQPSALPEQVRAISAGVGVVGRFRTDVVRAAERPPRAREPGGDPDEVLRERWSEEELFDPRPQPIVADRLA